MTRLIQAAIVGGVLTAGALLTGCGGKYRAQCQRTYDDCTNACADTCSSPRAQEAGSEPDRVNTYSPRCKVCVDQCSAQANRCEARESESVGPDEDAPGAAE